ncbi:MAG TPA: family 43 glycosylhydrolase [Jatrophihabitans sp.]|jgi:arabinan endo-1,5-alpha-L-arabinosidase|uniref:family 43 glycosylhydrolase n=1 Tax=Jatrophihabitans sp. TaxID=1932789 RepID=UPI002EEF3C72
MRWSRKIVLPMLALATAASGIVAAGPTSAGTVATTGKQQSQQRYAPSYTNPLKLRLPSGALAESCADPDVLRGQGADRHWYLYCTTDALTASEVGPTGSPVLHNVPMFKSLDLINWTYQGDAFPTKPAWVTGFVWAPEVVYRNGKYMLYFGASDTSLPGGGSAIGVATSNSPTGPWTDSGQQVVEPQGAPGSRRWIFDPEVLDANGVSYLYFGSYFGGISVRRLSADGLSTDPASQTQVAIDNRYEGTHILKRDGWYYLLASATNCCAGPLTGYSVFAGRSRSPLGPFVDRHGVSLLAGRVGGTPVVAQNGNRWVGVGHHTVITDFDGQQWMVYHAVDRNDPYYADEVGYTKRPALIDPLDWRHGWPTVRAGRGPSDSPMPGPAAQPGQRTAYKPRFVHEPHPTRLYKSLSDEFRSDTLSKQWTWIRPPAAGSYRLDSGQLRWQTQAADIHPPATPLASVLTQPAPKGNYVVETKVRVTTPPEGCCFNYVQGGLVIYNDDANYLKLTSASIWNTRQTEFGKQMTPVAEGYPSYGNAVVGPVGTTTYLRIVRIGERYTAYTSLDGKRWDKGATWTQANSPNTKIGLVSMGGAGFSSNFDYVRVSAVHVHPHWDD